MSRILIIVFLVVLCLAALFFIDHHYRAHVRQENLRQLNESRELVGQDLESGVSRIVLIAQNLGAFLQAYPSLPDRDVFDHYAARVVTHSEDIRALEYADQDRIIRYVYPLQGNEAALDLDLMSRPAAPFVEKAILTKSTTVSDPQRLAQGSLAIVARSPMFAGDRFVGLAQVVADISSLVEGTSRKFSPQFAFSLSDSSGEVFWEPDKPFGKSVTTTIPVGGSHWQLTLSRVGPELSPQSHLLVLIWGLGGVLCLAIIVAIHQTFRRMDTLESAVAARTGELAESESRYRTLVETADDVIMVIDMSGRVLFRNSAYYFSLGFGPEDKFESDGFERVHPDDKNMFRERMAELLDKGSLDAEYRVRHKDGHWVYRSARCKLMNDDQGHPQSILMISRDITERRLRAKELQESRSLLQSMFANLSDAVFIINPKDRTIMLCNPAVENVFGYTPDELIGKNTAMLHVDQAAYNRFAELGDPELQEKRIWRTEFEMRRRDGAIIATENTVTTQDDKTNWDSGVIVSVVRDISENKKLEESRAQLEKQYIQAQKMEVVGQLTAGIAHDFNNLLMAITGSAQLMQLQLPADSPLNARTEVILQAGLKAADVIRQLLIFSRKQISAPQIVDLNAVVSGMMSILDRIIGEHIGVKLGLSPGLWSVEIDPAQLEQVVVNLIVNARDAMPQGGQLRLETENIVLDESACAGRLDAEPGEYVCLTVSDNGTGMDRKVQSRLFEPFFTTKGPGKGTGLGLATVHGIVTQRGGHIAVSSEVGQGSSFSVCLPRSMEVASQRLAPPRQALERGHETVLLVEDETDIRLTAREILAQQGFTVLDAKDGMEALGVAKQYAGTIDLLLTDVIMPGMNGKALAEALSGQYPKLKVIYMSGYTDEVLAPHGILEPGIHLLQKPFSLIDMMQKIREVLG